MEIKVNAIALRSVDYKESDKMLTLFSVERGIISAGIRGVKKANAKLNFCAHPFCFAEYVLSCKNERYTVVGASEIESFYNIRTDLLNFYAGSCVLEFLLKECVEDEPNEPLFMHTVNTLKKIAFGEFKAKQYLIKYLVKALELIGYGFTFKCCLRCGGELDGYERCYFDFEKGGAVCPNCASGEIREIMPSTILGLFDVVNGLDVPEQTQNYILKFLNFYIQYKTGAVISGITELVKLSNV